MVMSRLQLVAIAATSCIATFSLGSSALAGSVEQGMAGLKDGSYRLRDLATKQSTRICLKSRADLVQLRHPGLACEHFVVREQGNALKLHYTCPGHGWGLTDVRVETPGLALIESQGIAEGLPFSLSAELRYEGRC